MMLLMLLQLRKSGFLSRFVLAECRKNGFVAGKASSPSLMNIITDIRVERVTIWKNIW